MDGAPEGLMWGPKRAVFIRRTLILGALTFLFFLIPSILIVRNWQLFPLSNIVMPLVMALVLMMDDFNRWRLVRSERWEIAEGQLIHDGVDGRATIPLSEISAVKQRFGTAIIIRLHSGQRIMMRYLANPAEIANHFDKLLAPEPA